VGKLKWFWGFARSLSHKFHTEQRKERRGERRENPEKAFL